MSKKIISLLIVICISAGLVGCSFNGKGGSTQKDDTTGSSNYKDKENFTDISADNVETNEYYTPVDIVLGYNNLTTDDQRDCYREMDECVNQVSREVTEEGTYLCKMLTLNNVVLTQSEIRLVISAYKHDHPIVFWLTDNFGYSNTGGYTALQLYSYESPEKIGRMQKALYGRINSFVSSVGGGLDSYNLELLAHDEVIGACDYADNVKSAKDDYLAFTPYGALVKGSAVCEGYAKTFQYFLSLLGIESTIITGRGSSELHMWNGVNLDGSWYYVDPSWDDGEDYSRYDYFNITQEQLLADHTISGVYSDFTSDEICGAGDGSAVNFNIFVPQCNSTRDNYYVRSCCHFTDIYDYYNEDIINALYQGANAGEKYFHIYIDPLYLYYPTAVDQLFNSGDQLFFTYVKSVNNMNPVHIIDADNISIVKKENLSVVTVQISY